MTLQNEPINNDQVLKKYCRFKKSGIKYIDYKDGNFLLKFVNDQGKILPRRLTGTSLKFQRKVAQAIKERDILLFYHMRLTLLNKTVMDVILSEDIKGLGYKNDIVKVKAGYGRNYLIPKGIAMLPVNQTGK